MNNRYCRAGLELKSLPADLVVDDGGNPNVLPRPGLLREGGYAFLLERLLRSNNIQSRGVIHLGANIGQEALPYMMLGVPKVLFVEAVPQVFVSLQRNVSMLNRLDQSFRDFLNVSVGTEFRAVEAVIGTKVGTTPFFVTGSDLFGSTRRPLDFQPWFEHVLDRSTSDEAAAFREWAQTATVTLEELELPMITMDVLTQDNLPEGWLRDDFNLLNMNIQGGEIDALTGGPETLEGIELIVTEVNFHEFYESCAQQADLDALLRSHRFHQVTELRAGPVGTAFYVRSD